jgi:hypothetical protein
VAKAARKRKISHASSTEQQAPFDPAEWIPWHKACALAPDDFTAVNELDAARHAGNVRALVRYSAPDGTVEWRQPPADLRFVSDGWGNEIPDSAEWTEERRKRGGGIYLVFVHRAEVGRLWPDISQSPVPATPAVPATSVANPRGAGRGPMPARGLMAAECFRRFGDDGIPADREISKFAKRLLAWYEKRFGEKNGPEFRTVRDWVGSWLKAWIATLPPK